MAVVVAGADCTTSGRSRSRSNNNENNNNNNNNSASGTSAADGGKMDTDAASTASSSANDPRMENLFAQLNLSNGTTNSSSSTTNLDDLSRAVHSQLNLVNNLGPREMKTVAEKLLHLSLNNNNSIASGTATSGGGGGSGSPPPRSASGSISSSGYARGRTHRPSWSASAGGESFGVGSLDMSNLSLSSSLHQPHRPPAAASSSSSSHHQHHPPQQRHRRTHSRGRSFHDEGPSTAAPQPPSREASPVRHASAASQQQQHHSNHLPQQPQQQQQGRNRPRTPIRSLFGGLGGGSNHSSSSANHSNHRSHSQPPTSHNNHVPTSPFRLFGKNRGGKVGAAAASSSTTATQQQQQQHEEKKESQQHYQNQNHPTVASSCPSSPAPGHYAPPPQQQQQQKQPHRSTLPERAASPLFNNMNPVFQQRHNNPITSAGAAASTANSNNFSTVNSGYTGGSASTAAARPGLHDADADHAAANNVVPAGRGRCSNLGSSDDMMGRSPIRGRQRSLSRNRPRTPSHDDGGGDSQPAPPPRAYSKSPMRNHQMLNAAASSNPLSPVRQAVADMNLRNGGLPSPSQTRKHELPTGAEDQPPPSPAHRKHELPTGAEDQPPPSPAAHRGRSVTRRGWPMQQTQQQQQHNAATAVQATTSQDLRQEVEVVAQSKSMDAAAAAAPSMMGESQSLFTPPPVRPAHSADDLNLHAPPMPEPPKDMNHPHPGFKTGVSKHRRKGGTPPMMQQHHHLNATAGSAGIPPAFSTSTSFDSAPSSFMAGAPQMPSFGSHHHQPHNIGIHPNEQQQSHHPNPFASMGGGGVRRKIHARRPGLNSNGGAPRPRMASADHIMDPLVPVVGLRGRTAGPSNNLRTHSPRPPSPMEVDSVQGMNFHMGNANRKPAPSAASTPSRNHSRRPYDRPPAASSFVAQAQQQQAIPTAAVPVEQSVPSQASSGPEAQQEPPTPMAAPDYVEMVEKFREEAKALYFNSEYKFSILAYTKAIEAYQKIPPGQVSSDMLAVLYSNRAAAFMMIGAYEAAQKTCQTALPLVSSPGERCENFSNESGPPLLAKLFVRLARALLQQGDYGGAAAAFGDALATEKEASELIERVLDDDVGTIETTLPQSKIEATLGKADAERLEEAIKKLDETMPNTESRKGLPNTESRKGLAEALGHVNTALKTASGFVSLVETKLTLLGKMKRWREAASCCERLAARNARLDGIFVGSEEMEAMNPFPGATTPARNLAPTFFEESGEDDARTADLKLNSKAVGEAILRLPSSLTIFYIRALRLQERYPAADMALQALENLVVHGTRGNTPRELQARFSWLERERSKWKRTRKCRELGDELFRNGEFKLALIEYERCLKIDSEDGPSNGDSVKSSVATGGRLHAVLHCNRAACLMALREYEEALKECTWALQIHSRYMKAMLRRARCYTRLGRNQEAKAEYKRWLELVDDARKSPQSATAFVTPCVFDGPRDVTDADITTVNSELKTVHAALRKAEAAAQEEAARRQQRQRWQEDFASSSSTSNPSSSAHQRREQWYNSEGSGRWDSFRGRTPRSSSNGPGNPRRGASAGANPQHQHQRRYGSWGQEEPNHNNAHRHDYRRSNTAGAAEVGSPGSDLSVTHYQVLGLDITATEAQIKKAWKTLANKYHPDKNKDPKAVATYRRVIKARDCLTVPADKQRYDQELREQQQQNNRYY